MKQYEKFMAISSMANILSLALGIIWRRCEASFSKRKLWLAARMPESEKYGCRKQHIYQQWRSLLSESAAEMALLVTAAETEAAAASAVALMRLKTKATFGYKLNGGNGGGA